MHRFKSAGCLEKFAGSTSTDRTIAVVEIVRRVHEGRAASHFHVMRISYRSVYKVRSK